MPPAPASSSSSASAKGRRTFTRRRPSAASPGDGRICPMSIGGPRHVKDKAVLS
jgi:hypothetical protein